MVLDPKKTRRHLYKEPEMEMRSVLTLLPINSFDEKTMQIHLDNNRVLQAGFSVKESSQLLPLLMDTFSQDADGKPISKTVWLTDFIQPTPQAALILRIATEIICNYQVGPNEYKATTEHIYQELLKQNPDFENKLNEDIQKELNVLQDIIEQSARDKLAKFHLDETKFPQLIELETLSKGKEVTNRLVREYVKEHQAIFSDLGAKKTALKGENHDHCILGAAGSGKSHMLKITHPHLDKKDKIILATDEYRSLYEIETLDNQGAAEPTASSSNQQGFTKTQDIAYLIKELVIEEILLMERRPNLLIDCVTLEYEYDKLLSESANNLDSRIACMPDVRPVATRAFDRATSPTALPADAGRQINTTSLLDGHKSASLKVLDNLPSGVETSLMDTKCIPACFAIASTTDFQRINLKIFSLDVAGDFFAKTNINTEARVAQEIYRKNNEKYHAFKYDSFHKARSILCQLETDAASPRRNKEKTITLTEVDSKKDYCSFTMVKDNHKTLIKMEILDKDLYEQQLAKNPLLTEMLIQAYSYNKMVQADKLKTPFSADETKQALIKEQFTLGKKALAVESQQLIPFSFDRK